MASKSLTAGDKVKWEAAGGEVHGTVVKKETGTTKVKGHTAKASTKDPQFRVKSSKSGKEAVHKADELKKA
jgi:plastocyanin